MPITGVSNRNYPALSEVVRLTQQCPVGKKLPSAFYIHVSALESLAKELLMYERQARQHLGRGVPFTLLKFQFDKPYISYLHYPNFEQEAHPALAASTQVHVYSGDLDYRDYSQRSNPPILHRKETFVSLDHPRYIEFATLTRQQEALGLFKESRTIGTLKGWQQALAKQGLEIHEHALACPLNSTLAPSPNKQPQRIIKGKAVDGKRGRTTNRRDLQIDRHKAAIHRNALSKPIRLALEAGVLQDNSTFFDYGCGHGGDVERLSKQGIYSFGWDPYYRDNQDKLPADVVNLGYIINVIEDQRERRSALVEAWGLAREVLIVAAQVLVNDQSQCLIAYEDGIITNRNTFQKYFEQEELKTYIDQVIGSEGDAVDAIPVALGIYFVFRDQARSEAFRASRFRSRASTPRVRISVQRFEEYKEMLEPLMGFYTERGRLPVQEEIQDFATLTEQFGSLRRAFKLVFQATGVSEWDAISDTRRNDLLVYLALSRFERRPKFSALASVTQRDIKGLFGSYQQACAAADLMLMSVGNLELLNQRAQASEIGQLRSHSFWIHISAIEQLDPLLRLYEGCASQTLGRPDGANIVKFNLHRPQISYLFCPEFDQEPHPPIHTSMQIDLQDLHVRYRDYNPEDNPPLLYLKDKLVPTDYPQHAKFAKLTKQEADWGLLDNPEHLKNWRKLQHCLKEHCAELKGHRLVWRKDVEPYKLKLCKAAVRSRKRSSNDHE